MISVAEGKNLLKKLERAATRIVKVTPAAAGNVKKSGKTDVFLLGSKEMKRLKKKFLPRNKGPANVLSFSEPMDWPSPGKGVGKLGEVYLNLDLTEGKMDKLVPLLLHGILHILGYDHKKKSDIIKMENLEKKLLKTLDTRY